MRKTNPEKDYLVLLSAAHHTILQIFQALPSVVSVVQLMSQWFAALANENLP